MVKTEVKWRVKTYKKRATIEYYTPDDSCWNCAGEIRFNKSNWMVGVDLKKRLEESRTIQID